MATAAAALPSSLRTWRSHVARRKPPQGATGSEAHYEDGQYYDQAYRLRRHDVRFYTDLALKSGGPVALAIAKAGIEIVGVDPMEPMLSRARKRIESLPRAVRERIELRKGTLERLRLRRKFPLVIAPFNVWMHLYTRREIERGCATVRHHLEARGRFAFDVLLPDPVSLARDP